MTIELTVLGWTLILALLQIVLTTSLRTRETGLPWNAGPRDIPSRAPIGLVTARMMRAQTNLFETLPIFIGAVLVTQIAHIHSPLTYWGVMLYFWARVVYIPLYGFGIPYARSVVWGVGLVGIILLLTSFLKLA